MGPGRHLLALSSLTKVTGGFSGPWPERNEAGGEAPGTGPPQALELPLACSLHAQLSSRDGEMGEAWQFVEGRSEGRLHLHLGPVLGFPPRRGLTPRGSLECNPEIPAFP